jgi:3'(2'), 5'-bisphosphate nucleotidase
MILGSYEKTRNIELKPDRTLVTNIDKKVSELIISGLKRNFPDYGILDEEQGGSKLERRKVFVVDPLDNTKGYIDKTGDFGILLGLVDKNETVLGITYNPQKNEFAYAARGYGSFMLKNNNTTRLNVSDSKEVHALVSSSRSSEEMEAMLKRINPRSLRYMGGSLKTVEVAKGNATLFLCPKSSSMSTWDICAPSIILKEANGKITNLRGEEFRFKGNKNYDGVVATNGYIHDKILERISPIVYL